MSSTNHPSKPYYHPGATPQSGFYPPYSPPPYSPPPYSSAPPPHSSVPSVHSSVSQPYAPVSAPYSTSPQPAPTRITYATPVYNQNARPVVTAQGQPISVIYNPADQHATYIVNTTDAHVRSLRRMHCIRITLALISLTLVITTLVLIMTV